MELVDEFYPYQLHYIIGSKYDTVDESVEPAIFHPFRKMRYLNMHYNEGDMHAYIFNSLTGFVIAYNLKNYEQVILNYKNAQELVGYIGIYVDKNNNYYFIDKKGYLKIFDSQFQIIKEFELPFSPDSFTASDNIFYFYFRDNAEIAIWHIQTHAYIKKKANGIGDKGLCINKKELWLADEEENLIDVYDIENFNIKFSIITPFIAPVDVIMCNEEVMVLYSGQVTQTSYNAVAWFEQQPFIHQLRYEIFERNGFNYTLSNRFLIEFRYEECFNPVNSLQNIEKLTVNLAIPIDTIRQKLVDVRAIGIPFKAVQKNQEFSKAVFDIGAVNAAKSQFLIGYKCFMMLAGIKYTIKNIVKFDTFDYSSFDIANNIELTNDKGELSGYMKDFSEVGSFESIVDKVMALRNKVFDALYYKPNMYAADYVEVLKDGYGTCGDYSGIIAAICRLNKIPVRIIGGFKVPRFTNSQFESLSYYYNHYWLEFYVPGIGWLPMESSSDDKEYMKRFCNGQFMGEDWTHIRTHLDKAIPNFIETSDVENKTHPYDLFKNNMFYRILGEKL